MRGLGDELEGLFRRLSILAAIADVELDLLLQSGDADFEKFIQI